MDSFFVIDEFVNVRPGEPFRLLPFGTLIKSGKKRDITPEMAGEFKLPHFQPPVKLGSHAPETPAGGHIKSLFVGDDGLYCWPDWTDKGWKAVVEGDYKYHSPEIIWKGMGLEDPKSGEIIEGPLIVGDALLHNPHLGEEVALYEYQVTTEKGDENMGDTVEVPIKFWDKFMAGLFVNPPEKPEVKEPEVPTVDVEKFEAMELERDDYKAKIETMEAEKEQKEKMSAIAKEFDTEEYGTAYIELGNAEESAEVLAGMSDEQRDWVMTNFKALSKQIKDSALIGELGTTGEGIDEDDAAGQLNAVVLARAKEDKSSYAAALSLVSAEQPELVEAYGGK